MRSATGEIRRGPNGAQVYVTPDERGETHTNFPSVCDDELTWYYQEADGEMGARSVYAALLASHERGTAVGSGVPETTPSAEVLRAAQRQRKVRAVLAVLTPRDQITLAAVYTKARDPRYRLPWLGTVDDDLRLVLFTTGLDPQAVERVVRVGTTGTASQSGPYRKLLAKATRLVTAARQAYVAARRDHISNHRSEKNERRAEFVRLTGG